jgi:nucleoside-diphosphate kinase
MNAPSSIRAAFGTDGVKNAVHGAGSPGQQKAEADLFFSSACGTSAYFNNCTLAIIKPHIVKAGLAGEIIDTILEEGFEISAMQMFTLDKPTAEEFLEVYKGVLPEFT